MGRPRTALYALLASIFCIPHLEFAAGQQRAVPAVTVSGSASIAGQVVTDEAAPRPVRRAIVTVAGDLESSRSVITDDDGRFLFRNLPAGRFTVTATKVAFLTSSYGSSRPGRPGTPVSLAAGQQIDLSLRMARGAVLTGIVRDRSGAPMSGASVTAIDPRASDSPNVSQSQTASVTTDDRGLYRIFGLLPGEYLLVAATRPSGSGQITTRSASELDAVLAELAQRNRSTLAGTPLAVARGTALIAPPEAVGFAPTYFPGTPVKQDAMRIRVAAGDERGGLDFQLSVERPASLEGNVSGPIQNLAVTQLSITGAGQRSVSSQDTNPILSLRPGADGNFRFTNVMPGRYTIGARANRNQTSPSPAQPPGVISTGGAQPNANTGDYLYAVAEVDVRGSDIAGIALSLQPGSTFSGTVKFDATNLRPLADLSRIRVNISPPGGTFSMNTNGTLIGNTFGAVAPTQLSPDGSFALTGIAPGRYVLNTLFPADAGAGWWLRSAIVNGRDVLDVPLQFTPGVNVAGAVLTFSDRHTELSGSLQTPTGQPATDYFIVVVPADRTMWEAGSRRVKMTRPSNDGTFAVRDLPGGDYLIAALSDVEPADLSDAQFLEQLARTAVRINLADGEKKTQNLRIAGGS